MQWLIVLPTLLFLISIINFFTIKQPRIHREIKDFVSVIVPLRNEAGNIEPLISALAAQVSLTHVEFILLDDDSQDQTWNLLQKNTAELDNFHLIKTAPLPAGWIGKSWGLKQLLDAAHGEIIVSLDADVRIKPDAISRSIALLEDLDLDFISPYPRQITKSLAERLVQPLLQWSWLSTLILPIAQRSSFTSMAVANGQFFIVRKSALVQAGGYEAVKSAVLDDVFLARALLKSKAHGVVVNGADIAQCRMYSSWGEIKFGYGKSLRHGFGSPVGLLTALIFLLITGIAPIVIALTGSIWGWIGYGLITCTRLLSAIIARARLFDALLHPLSTALLIYLILYSYIKRGQIQWKGRTI